MDEPVVDDAALLKQKPKREKTDKQKEVWAKAQQTRLGNAQLKKDALAKAKEDIENKKYKKTVNKAEPDEPELEPEPKSKYLAKPKPKPKVVYESDSEAEVVVIKKKKKQVIYEEESSEEEAPPPKKQKSAVVIPPIAIPQKSGPIVRFF